MKKEVKDVYEGISDSWHSVKSRQKYMFAKWFEILNLRWKKGKVLDIGCGNAKNLVCIKNLELHGTDVSAGMIRNSKKYCEKHDIDIDFTIGDAENLPYSANSFDYVISTAVMHHMEGACRRALLELMRVLKPDGEAFVTVWYKFFERNILRRKDVFVPWTTHGKTYYRYYHLYSFRELRDIIKEVGFEIIHEGSEKGFGITDKLKARNICFLIKRPGGKNSG